MKQIFILTVCLLSLLSCFNQHRFWEISKFNLVDTALTNGEEIKLLYTSRAPDDNEDKEYYIHIIAVSQKTGDTVNILTTVNNGKFIEDGNRKFNYFDQNDIGSRLIQSGEDKFNDVLKDINDKVDNKTKLVGKVVRDPKFDYIADNNYPTVIGVIGTIDK